MEMYEIEETDDSELAAQKEATSLRYINSVTYIRK